MCHNYNRATKNWKESIYFLYNLKQIFVILNETMKMMMPTLKSEVWIRRKSVDKTNNLISLVILIVSVILCSLSAANGQPNGSMYPLKISQQDLLVRVGDNISVIISRTSYFNKTLFENETETTLVFTPSSNGIIRPIPNVTLVSDSQKDFENATIIIEALVPGRVTIPSHVEPHVYNFSTANVFLRVSAYKYSVLIIISEVVGWLYFVAWSISFYPQIYQNWRRRSVRGLSLDFVFLNWTGFVVYGMFNVGLYAVPSIQEEYLIRHPTSLIPVQINDVFFTLHAIFAATITCCQCIFYDKGAQTVSKTGKTILMSVLAVIFVFFVVTISRAILWLDFLTACSTIKLLITLIKYVPQAYFNYARKSTSGWCIGNVLLDLTGGILSVLQMMLLAFNNDDWISLFGDYTKFGLGAFSISFDLFFIVQHYILYKSHEAYEPIEGTTLPGIEDQEDITTSNHLQTTESDGGGITASTGGNTDP